MEVRRPGMGIAALIVAFAAYGIILDEPAAVLAVILLSTFLLYRAVTFLRNLRAVAGSLRITRTPDKSIMRQGTSVKLHSTASLEVPHGMEAVISDLLPPVADEGVAPPYTPSADGSFSVSYQLGIMAQGETRFEGVLLTLSDPFFSGTMRCSGAEFRTPALRAVPYSVMHGAEGDGTGSNEDPKRGLISGQEICSFREYVKGDDYSLIDWKFSAKRDKLIVRQRGHISGGAPLIIIDLPEKGVDEGSARAFFTLIGGVVRGALDTPGTCPILIISGANLIRYLPPGTALHEIALEMDRFEPMQRLNHLFRMPGRAVTEARKRKLREVTPLNEILQEVATTPFENTIRGIMSDSETGEAHLYSMYRGDLSHISQTILAAKIKGMGIRLLVPRQEASAIVRLREYGSDRIEVI